MADVGLGLDTLATGGVTGMLIAVMIAFLRRTKDTDVRRDEGSKMVMEAALEREERAWSERDKALAERDVARTDTERVRSIWEAERRRWEEDRLWLLTSHETEVTTLRRAVETGEMPVISTNPDPDLPETD